MVSSITTIPASLGSVLATGYSHLVVAGTVLATKNSSFAKNVLNESSEFSECRWLVQFFYEFANSGQPIYVFFDDMSTNPAMLISESLTLENETNANLTFIQPLKRGSLTVRIKCNFSDLEKVESIVSANLLNITVKGKKYSNAVPVYRIVN